MGRFSLRVRETIAAALPRASDLLSYRLASKSTAGVLKRFVQVGAQSRFKRPSDLQAQKLISYAEQLHLRELLTMTKDEANTARTADQGSASWHAARVGRVSASVIGQAVGLGYKKEEFQNEDELLLRMLWDPPFDKKVQGFLEYGRDHEDWARQLFVMWLIENWEPKEDDLEVYESVQDAVAVYEEGLLVTEDYRFPSSADGVVRLGRSTVAYLEIKCPASREFYDKRGKIIPEGHYSQITIGMHNQQQRPDCAECRSSFYVVYTPEAFQVQLFPFVQENCMFIRERAVDFFENCYIPRAHLKRQNKLEKNKIHPVDPTVPAPLSAADLVYAHMIGAV